MSFNEIILLSEETRSKIIESKNEAERFKIKKQIFIKSAQLLKKRKINLNYLKNNAVDAEYRYKQKENDRIRKELVEQHSLLKLNINYDLSFEDFIKRIASVLNNE